MAAELDRLDRGGDRGIAGEDDDARVLIERLELFHQLQARRSRHLEVDDRALRWIGTGRGQGLAESRIVIDEQ